jgi:hypothetical protein
MPIGDTITASPASLSTTRGLFWTLAVALAWALAMATAMAGALALMQMLYHGRV